MDQAREPAGCRTTFIATAFLLGVAVVFMVSGLALATGCGGPCETLGLTMLYAGGPVSALFGVLFGGLVVAWPLDITFWVVAGFLVARRSARRGRAPLGIALVAILIALAYGLVLSLMVEIAV